MHIRFLTRLIRRFSPQPDEILGEWFTSNDGGIHMLFGCQVSFMADGSGRDVSWGFAPASEDGDEPYEHVEPFRWRRTGPKTIEVKKPEYAEWKTISYAISHYEDGYRIPYFKLVEVGYKGFSMYGDEGFWSVPQAVFKAKPRGK